MHEMELQLELTLSRNSSSRNLLQRNKQLMGKISRKRSFGNALEFDDDDDEDEVNSIDVVPQTLPLFVWKGIREDEDENGVVGWPPIKSSRKQIRYHCGNSGGGGGDGRSNREWMYVKVNMEGFGIGRKVDLSIHHSFVTLVNTLKLMFDKCCENEKSYRLTYQDKEGDWLLAGDVPWGDFIQKVQRLKLIKEWKIICNCRGSYQPTPVDHEL